MDINLLIADLDLLWLNSAIVESSECGPRPLPGNTVPAPPQIPRSAVWNRTDSGIERPGLAGR